MISVARKKTKKAAKRTKRKAPKQSTWPFIVGLIIIIAAVIGAVLLLNRAGQAPATGEHIVLVNGEPITEGDFLLRKSLMPAQLQQQLGDESIVEQLITEELLEQEANEMGISATAEEVAQSVDILLQRAGLTEAELEPTLNEYGLTRADFERMISSQISIIKLLNRTLSDEVTEEEVRTYYEENKDQFFSEGTATVQHILIGTANRTAAEAEQLAEDILDEYEAGAGFCGLVEQHSEDAGSIEECGRYSFAMGSMVPAFEDASFAMEPNETRIVETQFGYHVILKIGEAEGKQLSFEEMQPWIENELRTVKQQQEYARYVAELREEAVITYADGTSGPAEMASPEVEEAPEVPQETPPVEQKPTSFAACLADAGVVLYTASWDARSRAEYTKFGSDAQYLARVECTEEPARCEAAGIQAYPTWVINGEKVLGEVSLETLAQLTGC